MSRGLKILKLCSKEASELATRIDHNNIIISTEKEPLERGDDVTFGATNLDCLEDPTEDIIMNKCTDQSREECEEQEVLYNDIIITDTEPNKLDTSGVEINSTFYLEDNPLISVIELENACREASDHNYTIIQFPFENNDLPQKSIDTTSLKLAEKNNTDGEMNVQVLSCILPDEQNNFQNIMEAPSEVILDTDEHQTIAQEEKKTQNEPDIEDTESISLLETTRTNNAGLSVLKSKRTNKRDTKKKARDNGVNKKVRINPCLNKRCQNNCKAVSDIDRQKLFDEYYKFNSYVERKNFLLQCMKKKDIGRKRTKAIVSKKTKTVEYGVTINGKYRKVCQQFLLKTLDISQMTLRQTLDNMSKSGRIKNDMRGRKMPKNKKGNEDIIRVKKFIEKIPVVPSHYCRSKTKKLYMPSEIRNFSNLFRIYKESCNTEQKEAVGKSTFFRVFKNYNLGIHVPKKDKCSLCEKVKSVGEENFEDVEKYKRHRTEIDASRLKFKNDQENDNPNFLCASFDLQKVLTTPHGKSILLYYSRKLAVYNFTVYESRTRNGFCFLWNETLGKKGSNEICTTLNMYLDMLDKRTSPEIHELSLYCDNCSGQNKNKQLLTMIHRFLQMSVHIKKITVNYLIAGHTYMPVDSMHSTIESFITEKTIFAPSMWSAAIQFARHNPHQYSVFSLNFTDFNDYSQLTKHMATHSSIITDCHKPEGVVNQDTQLTRKAKKIRNSEILKGKPLQISKVQIVDVEAQNPKISVKYSYINECANKLEFAIKETNQSMKPLSKCYNSLLPISASKYKDLLKLCSNCVIPKDYHDEYKGLPHNKDIIDVLPDTDEEDELE